MRVVVNRLEALKQKTGIGHYTDQLLRCLRRQAGTDHIDCFPTGWLGRAWKAGIAAPSLWTARSNNQRRGHGRPSSLLGKLDSSARQWLRHYSLSLVGRHFRALCRRQQYDLYHEPNFIPFRTDCPTVATVHDLSLLLHPEWHPIDRVRYFERHYRGAVDGCCHFLTDSEFVRREMMRILGIPSERISRVYCGVRSQLRPLPPGQVAQTLQRLGLPPRYLLYVGTIEPRKNILLLLRAFCDLPGSVRDRWPLLLAGRWGWQTAQVAEYFHAVARHRGVLHTGYVPEEHLAALYNGGRALVYPSLYEGFGLPPLEMMACGGAVLASTAEAIAETAGNQAHLIPPGDLESWRSALARVATDDDWWQSLRHGAEAVARRYTWEQCAAQTLHLYRKLTGVSQAKPEQPALENSLPRQAAG